MMVENQDPPPVSAARVLVTVLVIVACAGVAGSFMLSNSSPWFWPTIGLAVASGAVAMLVPLGRKAG